MRIGGFERLRITKAVLAIFAIGALISPLNPTLSTRAVTARADGEVPVPRELEAFQGYLDPAPRGMDVRYAWTLPGGKGENIKLIDIEVNWNLNHQDLVEAASNSFLVVRGVDPQPQFNVDHGTAVLGELVAAPDGVGVTGIAHRAQLGLINPVSQGTAPKVADAIKMATRRLDPGDILLIEQQSLAGPRFDGLTGRGLLPIEFEKPVFDAIKAATSKGIIVIEPAGNGFENLDDPAYKGVFDRKVQDSGAIFVGAGLPEPGIYGAGPDRVKTEESNYGSRVDVQGWGRFVTTCGYGPLRREQGPNKIYTDIFGATSAAAAMVAGAAGVLQSIIKERGLDPLTPAQLRQLLISTGSPQKGNLSQRIGPRPDLKAAIEALAIDEHDRTPLITGLIYKKGKGSLIIDGANFLTGDSVIEIDGAAVPRVKYPAEFALPNGITSRLTTKGNINSMLPSGVQVAITVFSPSTGKRSEPVAFTKE
ncbi:MAG TPA: S8 family serine peptidase [Blastocatellia bacterium]|nr:S8 family serine peptidase [Blastocatellia bacterium]